MKHAIPHADSAPAAIVERDALAAAMDRIKLVTDARNTVPILSNMLMTSETGDLLLVGTDLDMEIRIRLPGEVDGRFETTVPVHLLASMCKKAPKAERVSITLGMLGDAKADSNAPVYETASFTFGKGQYRLHALPPADYPTLDEFNGETHRFEAPGSTFWNALDAVRMAVSTEETRYYLNGVFLTRTDASLRAVATDGHRLYAQDMLPPDGSSGMPGVIIPRKVVEILHKLLKGKLAPKMVSIRLDESYFQITWDNVTLRTKVIDGTFPDYARVLPQNNEHTVTIDAKALTDAVGAVTVISSERGKAIKVTLDPGICTLSVLNPDSGEASTSLDCDYDGPSMTVGLNSGYLLSVIATACPSGGDLAFRIADGESPLLVTGEEHGWTGCLMPTRV